MGRLITAGKVRKEESSRATGDGVKMGPLQREQDSIGSFDHVDTRKAARRSSSKAVLKGCIDCETGWRGCCFCDGKTWSCRKLSIPLDLLLPSRNSLGLIESRCKEANTLTNEAKSQSISFSGRSIKKASAASNREGIADSGQCGASTPPPFLLLP